MTEQIYSIKEAAKELGVEAHALRFWEEELGLAIARNEQGRRVYTENDMETFKKIQGLKMQGMQLKDIKNVLHKDSKKEENIQEADQSENTRIIMYRPKGYLQVEEQNKSIEDLEKQEKARRLQELLKQFISESIKESNAELMQMMKEGVLKELDYQFRLQEEREEERERVRIEMEDAHFKRLDEHLRNAVDKGKRKRVGLFGRKK